MKCIKYLRFETLKGENIHMGMNIGRGDNISKEMVREINLLENDRKVSNGATNPKKKTLGKIAFIIILLFIILIIALFFIL